LIREELSSRVAAVREKMGEAARRVGRKEGEVRLLAVTKFRPAIEVEAAVSLGLSLFGENRVAEAEEKYTSILGPGGRIELHMIGTLQSNKVRRATELFSCVESVHSARLLAEIAKRSSGSGRRMDVFLELHTGEESKSGFPDLNTLLAAAEASLSLPSVRLRGLMTMAPYVRDEGPIRASFRSLARAARELETRWPELGRIELSMGMSNDFEVAIEEGATIVRIGTALFGERG
jgi:PLP dependent protein